MIDYQPLITRWLEGDQERWAGQLKQQISAGLNHQRYGDLARWLQALNDLPHIKAETVHLDRARVGASTAALDPAKKARRLSMCVLFMAVFSSRGGS